MAETLLQQAFEGSRERLIAAILTLKKAKRLEYVESNGSQYVDTGIVGDPNSAVEIGMQALSTAKGRGIFGAYGPNASIYLYMSGSYDVWQYGFGEWADTNVGFDTSFHVFRIADFSLAIDGVVVHTLTHRNFTTAKHLMLFRTIDNGGSFYNTAPIRLHYARFYQSGTLVRDYIPVKDSAGVAGLLDLVSGQIFYSATSTALIAGPEAAPYFSRIEYLESTGTQYVDTGVAVSNPSMIRVETEEDVLQPLGFTHQQNVNGTWLASYAPPSVPTSNYVYYGTYANRTIITANENRKTAVYDGASGYYENGVQLTSFVAGIGSDSIAGRNWLFGAVWDFNASSADMRHSREGKIYGLKVYVSDVLVRDFVPVRLGTTGYLFDRVSGKFFGNAGTGSFVLGPDVA